MRMQMLFLYGLVGISTVTTGGCPQEAIVE